MEKKIAEMIATIIELACAVGYSIEFKNGQATTTDNETGYFGYSVTEKGNIKEL